MVNSLIFKNETEKLLNYLYESQKDNIEAAAQTMAECIEKGGVIHVFGSGHSTGCAIDLAGRIGSLVPIHICEPADCVIFRKVSFEEFTDHTNVFERKPGVAQFIYNLYNIKPNDIFFVLSNSGINGIGIDFAASAKEHGHKVIVITSMKHTLAENSRHPSGKKLYMLGDIVLDNCGPHGDALLETDDIEKVTAVSSICNNAIMQSASARTIEILQQHNYVPPVLNCDENHDKNLKDKYKGRI
ncbi:MAG: sugar isomerase domain-containing protein [Erysipelotrichia bacterium]|nr:sugar isomerase domain-containing protein [Erysipelotrichia bacterium]